MVTNFHLIRSKVTTWTNLKVYCTFVFVAAAIYHQVWYVSCLLWRRATKYRCCLLYHRHVPKPYGRWKETDWYSLLVRVWTHIDIFSKIVHHCRCSSEPDIRLALLLVVLASAKPSMPVYSKVKLWKRSCAQHPDYAVPHQCGSSWVKDTPL